MCVGGVVKGLQVLEGRRMLEPERWRVGRGMLSGGRGPVLHSGPTSR